MMRGMALRFRLLYICVSCGFVVHLHSWISTVGCVTFSQRGVLLNSMAIRGIRHFTHKLLEIFLLLYLAKLSRDYNHSRFSCGFGECWDSRWPPFFRGVLPGDPLAPFAHENWRWDTSGSFMGISVGGESQGLALFIKNVPRWLGGSWIHPLCSADRGFSCAMK